VSQVALDLADHAGHRVGDERVAVVGVVAVDGRDQADPGRLAQVLLAGPAAAPVALGQPVGQAEVGHDDLPADLGVAGPGVLEEPGLDAVDGELVAGEDVTDGRDRPGRVDHRTLHRSVVHGGWADESIYDTSTPASHKPQQPGCGPGQAGGKVPALGTSAGTS
jgi:hypothetical protein